MNSRNLFDRLHFEAPLAILLCLSLSQKSVRARTIVIPASKRGDAKPQKKAVAAYEHGKLGGPACPTALTQIHVCRRLCNDDRPSRESSFIKIKKK